MTVRESIGQHPQSDGLFHDARLRITGALGCGLRRLALGYDKLVGALAEHRIECYR